MQLSEYLRKLAKGNNPQAREAFAEMAGTSTAYLYQIAGGHRRAGLALARKIAIASCNEVSLHELRPDIAHMISGHMEISA